MLDKLRQEESQKEELTLVKALEAIDLLELIELIAITRSAHSAAIGNVVSGRYPEEEFGYIFIKIEQVLSAVENAVKNKFTAIKEEINKYLDNNDLIKPDELKNDLKTLINLIFNTSEDKENQLLPKTPVLYKKIMKSIITNVDELVQIGLKKDKIKEIIEDLIEGKNVEEEIKEVVRFLFL